MIQITETQQLADILKNKRLDLKISQTELADFSGLHRKGIANIELGKSDPRLSTILKIIELIGLKLYIEDQG